MTKLISAAPSRGPKILRWTSRLLIAATILAVLLFAIAGKGYAWGLWHYRVSFQLLTYSFFVGAGLAIIGLGVLIAALFMKRGRDVAFGLVGGITGGIISLTLMAMVTDARSYVPIHDVTTDLDDLPQFVEITPRVEDDSRAPAGAREDMAGLSPTERWRLYHEEAYGDLTTLQLDVPVSSATRSAADVARQMGWEVVTSDPENGRVEATATTPWFEFKDDVVIRVAANSGGSAVDVRSVSRVGISDIGANAKRIRDFLSALEARAGGSDR